MSQGVVRTTQRSNPAFEPQSVSVRGSVLHDPKSSEYAYAYAIGSSSAPAADEEEPQYAPVYETRTALTAEDEVIVHSYADLQGRRAEIDSADF